MKFSENWLRVFVNPSITGAELANALTMAGIEVESVEPAAPPFTHVVAGEVLQVKPHPNAGRLAVCSVAAGQREPLQIVCGAPNVAVGIKVPCALAGAQLPGLAIQASEVRGVSSEGMLCSAKVLGLAADDSGLLILDANARPGADVRAVLDLDDRIFTLKLTPNRGDCLSVYGIAREVAAITATSLGAPERKEVAVTAGKALPVRIAEPCACPRYCGRVIERASMRAAPPLWMLRRLERSGVRSHGAVVDVTNYVMLELGQPLHAFDLEKLDGGINVRFARAGETLKLINGNDVQLAFDMLVIADETKPLALAGIMGGEASAVGGSTRALFLESAFFSPQAIAGKARKLNLATDSSHRFERGVDFMATREALERATSLILEICGGEAGPVSEAQGQLPAREPIPLRAVRLRRMLGTDLGELVITSLLRRLQLSFTAQKETLYVLPPSFRFDLDIEEDLIEELARLHGYNRIPSQAGNAPQTILPQPEEVRSAATIKHVFAARDYQEIVSYSFVSPELDAAFAQGEHAIALANPMSNELSVMRTNLMGGLIECLRTNVQRKQPRVRIFESGRCFLPSADFSCQPERLAGLAYGSAFPEQWGESRAVDFYDIKGDIEALFHPRKIRFEAAAHPALHPGKSASIVLDTVAGVVGQLHPGLQQQFDLPQPAFIFELEWTLLTQKPLPAFAEISKFPAVRRDLAVVVAESLQAGEVLAALHALALPRVTEIALFDVYRGGQLAVGKKSLAFRVLLQDTQKTLNDEEVAEVVEKLKAFLATSFQAEFRE
jgi:phenylalanyl-tRNA synthetase beta chain